MAKVYRFLAPSSSFEEVEMDLSHADLMECVGECRGVSAHSAMRSPHAYLHTYRLPVDVADPGVSGLAGLAVHVDGGQQSLILVERETDLTRLCSLYDAVDLRARGLGVTTPEAEAEAA